MPTILARVAIGALVLIGFGGAAQGGWAEARPALALAAALAVAVSAGRGYRDVAAMLFAAVTIEGRDVAVEMPGVVIRPLGLVLAAALVAVCARGGHCWSRCSRWQRAVTATCLAVACVAAMAFALLRPHYGLSATVLRGVLLNALAVAAALMLWEAATGHATSSRADLPATEDAPPRIGLLQQRGLVVTGFLAVVCLPLTHRIDLPVAQVAIQDVLAVMAVLWLLPEAVRRRQRPPGALMPPLLLVAAAGLSVLSTTLTRAAVMDLVQLVAYCVFAVWMFTWLQGLPAWRRAQPFALLVAAACPAMFAVPAIIRADVSGVFPQTPYVLAGAGFLLASVLSGRRAATRRAIAGGCAALAILIAWYGLAEPGGSVEMHRVSERHREAYAAVSVLSEHPLFGVGLGNYQQHIGGYYQGMPKDNTLRPGTHVGHAVMLASTGLLGLAAYLGWLAWLWTTARGPYRKGAVGALLAAGFVTPMLTGPALLLTALTHGVIAGGGHVDD